MGITNRLAGFIVDTTFDAIPADVVQKSREMILNAVAIGVAGAAQEEGEIISRYAKSLGGVPSCTVFGGGYKTSPEVAAMVNGTLVHVLDYDEVLLRRANHPSNVILPTVAALGERFQMSGTRILEAFTIGCEVSTKIGAAGDFEKVIPSLNRNGWHIEGVAGVVGAAAAAGKLLGLTHEQMVNALGVAVSQAAGVQVNYGTSTKSFHCGMAAMHGIMAATLARDGFTAAQDSIESENGFFGCFRRDIDVDEDEFIDRLGNPYDVIDPGIGLKLYPCGSALHTAIDTMLYLKAEHGLTPDNVERIHVSWPPRAGNKLKHLSHPATGLEGKFSMTYVMSVALVHGPPRMHHFTDEAVMEPAVRALLDKVTVTTDEVATLKVSRPCTIRVELTDGTEVQHRSEVASGHPTNPLTVAQLDEKFMWCTEKVLTEDQARSVISDLRAIDELDDVQPLFAVLGGPTA